MLPSEIKAFAGRVGMNKDFSGKTVLVRAPKEKGGKYLSAQGFNAERDRASRFDYDRDNVGGQVEQCLAQGMNIEVELAD